MWRLPVFPRTWRWKTRERPQGRQIPPSLPPLTRDRRQTVNGCLLERFYDVLIYLPSLSLSSWAPGGYGWVIVAGAFAIHLFVFAPQYAYGVYSRYYYESQMYPGVSLTTITFVGAVAAAGCPAFGPISGRLSDLYGPRPVCFVGGCIVGIAFILASFSTQIWMLFLTQGFLYGLGQSLAYFPYIGTLPTWFGAKRGLAVGLAVSGTGIGGFAFGPLTNLMITNLSVQWSLRITGMIIFAMVSISAFVLRSRYKPIRRKSLIDFSFFKNRHFSMMWAVQLTGFFGFFSPYLFLSTYAASVGLSQSQGALIVGLTNLGSTLGRVIVGFGSDRLGPFNSFSLCIFLSGLSMMLIWPFSRSLGALIFFGMFYAFFSGGFVSLQPSCLSAIIGLQAMASAIGLLYFAGTAANLAGPPLSGALITNPNEPSGYIPMMMFGGAFMLLSGSIMLFLRMERAKWKMWVRV
ncbi:major facilitator superfamily domain-containing protein [Hyaloraphidium curvatum]|nr:major facilitator superfamily domain-containing protein [Hyaloraphidium curvatum]